MVIGAFSDPMAMSGSETGFATAAAIALCARAVAGTAGDAKARRAAKAMRQRTFNGYSETYWGKRRASSSCGLLIILLVLRAKGHLDRIAVDRELIAIHSWVTGCAKVARRTGCAGERAWHRCSPERAAADALDPEKCPATRPYDRRERGSLRRKRRDRRMMMSTSSSGIMWFNPGPTRRRAH
jgi:hypothetical protein